MDERHKKFRKKFVEPERLQEVPEIYDHTQLLNSEKRKNTNTSRRHWYMNHFIKNFTFSTISSKMTNFTRRSLLFNFPNTDPLKYQADAISSWLIRLVMSSKFGLVTSSTSLIQCRLFLITDVFLMIFDLEFVLSTLNIIGRGFPRLPGILFVAIISRSSISTLIFVFRKSCMSVHVFSLSFSVTPIILKLCLLEYFDCLVSRLPSKCIRFFAGLLSIHVLLCY